MRTFLAARSRCSTLRLAKNSYSSEQIGFSPCAQNPCSRWTVGMGIGMYRYVGVLTIPEAIWYPNVSTSSGVSFEAA